MFPPVPSRLLAVDPSPLVLDDEVELEPLAVEVFDVDWPEFVCAAATRSPKRFVDPRIAPRLDAGAPGAPDVTDCPFNAVFVLAEVELDWSDAAVEEEDVELVLLDVDDVLDVLVDEEALPISDFPVLP